MESWPKTKTKKEPLWSLLTVYRLPPLSLHSYHTQACGIIKCLTFAALSDCLRVCCCCSGFFHYCPPCADCRSSFPLHVFCPQLCQLLQDFPPGSPAAGAPWIRCGHWSQPGRECYSRPPLATFADRLWWSTPSHPVRDLHTVLSVVIVHHRLWFCLHPTKGAHTCVHGAQDADILPRLSPESHHHAVLNSSACCFTEGGAPIFVCPWCQPGYIMQLYNNELLSKFTSTAGGH